MLRVGRVRGPGLFLTARESLPHVVPTSPARDPSVLALGFGCQLWVSAAPQGPGVSLPGHSTPVSDHRSKELGCRGRRPEQGAGVTASGLGLPGLAVGLARPLTYTVWGGLGGGLGKTGLGPPGKGGTLTHRYFHVFSLLKSQYEGSKECLKEDKYTRMGEN